MRQPNTRHMEAGERGVDQEDFEEYAQEQETMAIAREQRIKALEALWILRR